MIKRRELREGDIYMGGWEGFLTSGALVFIITLLIGWERGWSLYTSVTGFLAGYLWILLLVLLGKLSAPPAYALLTMEKRKLYRTRALIVYVLGCTLALALLMFRFGKFDNGGLWLMFGAFLSIQLFPGIRQVVLSNRHEPRMIPRVEGLYPRMNDEQKFGLNWRGKPTWWR